MQKIYYMKSGGRRKDDIVGMKSARGNDMTTRYYDIMRYWGHIICDESTRTSNNFAAMVSPDGSKINWLNESAFDAMKRMIPKERHIQLDPVTKQDVEDCIRKIEFMNWDQTSEIVNAVNGRRTELDPAQWNACMYKAAKKFISECGRGRRAMLIDYATKLSGTKESITAEEAYANGTIHDEPEVKESMDDLLDSFKEAMQDLSNVLGTPISVATSDFPEAPVEEAPAEQELKARKIKVNDWHVFHLGKITDGMFQFIMTALASDKCKVDVL